ncbi:MAG: hypothetical protein OXH92_07910 [Bryobacterales bacterium]|nr:hypothetical protein [Bryobacterales bacterium]MDE0292846.1 hypothetical protein [Bryobacterales bacterium]MDE0433920.1 hypothetical protein [Bryobacterales bacterium]
MSRAGAANTRLRPVKLEQWRGKDRATGLSLSELPQEGHGADRLEPEPDRTLDENPQISCRGLRATLVAIEHELEALDVRSRRSDG